MPTRWEYLRVRYHYHRGMGDGEAEQYFSIRRPGARFSETEVRSRASIADWPRMLEAFGDEGWELVTETVTGSAVIEHDGRPSATIPVEICWTLKRPAG
jgi:hypothetical protein